MQATLATNSLDYNTLAAMTEQRDRTIGNNTYLVRLRGEAVAYVLHQTEIVTVHPDGYITLITGGHWTATTKSRMNDILRPLGVRIASVNHIWRITAADGTEHDYEDGMTLDPNGNLV